MKLLVGDHVRKKQVGYLSKIYGCVNKGKPHKNEHVLRFGYLTWFLAPVHKPKSSSQTGKKF